MTGRTLAFLVLALLLGSVSGSTAEPIGEAPAACFMTAWIAAERADCTRVCEAAGMRAEGLSLGPTVGDDIHLCRSRGAEAQGFGEQAGGVCRIGLADGFLATATSFECLCATAGCQPAGPHPQPALNEDCLPFNTAALSVENIGGRWKIVEGQSWLFDFADSEAAAREAFKVIHLNGFNQVCYIGRPDPSMTYLKTGASVPGGDAFGFDCISFATESVDIRPEDSGWLLLSSNVRMLLVPSEEEARMAKAVILTYGLDRQCFVGRPGPSFEFWMAP
jgi:hypothetical protein